MRRSLYLCLLAGLLPALAAQPTAAEERPINPFLELGPVVLHGSEADALMLAVGGFDPFDNWQVGRRAGRVPARPQAVLRRPRDRRARQSRGRPVRLLRAVFRPLGRPVLFHRSARGGRLARGQQPRPRRGLPVPRVDRSVLPVRQRPSPGRAGGAHLERRHPRAQSGRRGILSDLYAGARAAVLTLGAAGGSLRLPRPGRRASAQAPPRRALRGRARLRSPDCAHQEDA